MKDKEKKGYEDLLSLPHHVSPKRPHMAMTQRAAQFSPFMPLEGYEEAVKDTARHTDRKIELGEDAGEILDRRLRILQKQEEINPKVTVTYFQPDPQKEGGCYVSASGCVIKLDRNKGIMIMEDGARIPVEDMVMIEGEIFADFEDFVV